MASGLILDFKVAPSGSCDSFNFIDLVGEYDAASNPGGYNNMVNPPNSASGALVTATISVLPYLSIASPFVVNVKSGSIPFPNNNSVPFSVLGTSIGYSTNQPIPSQIVEITYAQTYDGATVNPTSKYAYLNCQHLCCAAKLWAKWCVMPCGNENEQMSQQEFKNLCIRVSGTIQAIEFAIKPDCPKLTEAQNMVTWLNTICAQYYPNGCGC